MFPNCAYLGDHTQFYLGVLTLEQIRKGLAQVREASNAFITMKVLRV